MAFRTRRRSERQGIDNAVGGFGQPVKGLYLAGAWVSPEAVSGVLRSGRNAFEQIMQDLRA